MIFEVRIYFDRNYFYIPNYFVVTKYQIFTRDESVNYGISRDVNRGDRQEKKEIFFRKNLPYYYHSTLAALRAFKKKQDECE